MTCMGLVDRRAGLQVGGRLGGGVLTVLENLHGSLNRVRNTDRVTCDRHSHGNLSCQDDEIVVQRDATGQSG
jgi:hypothetical protein